MIVYLSELKNMVDGKIRMFRANTPKYIADKATLINAHLAEIGGKPFFHFESEEN